ncbi:MAG: cyclic nucleotide-binding domain-containing protein [Thermoanaerobaculia bacterium]|nr:cyclic nucleotide-binding domain-containing protein [Thermoanaerobaculia bacterium]
MSDQPESISSLLARREYATAVPLLRKEAEKYPTNVRIKLQLADALAGAGLLDEALAAYDATAQFYQDAGLTVQVIGVQKKIDKVRAQLAATVVEPVAEEMPEPAFKDPTPKSPLFETMSEEERKAVVDEMVLEHFNEGDIVIAEGEPGSALYVIVHGGMKVYGKGPRGDSVYLANLGDGDFFGEVSVLTGKPRTATITASQKSELLRLDKEKLDGIVAKHPRVKSVLEDFYRKRASHTVEAMVDSLKQKK